MPPLAVTDRLVRCEDLKAAGNKDFKAGDNHAALRHYKKILLLLATFRKGAVAAPVVTPGSKLSSTESDQVAMLLTAANNNIAAVYVRLEDWPKAKRHAAAALETDETNVKAMTRFGTALLHLNDVDRADEVLTRAAHRHTTNDPLGRLIRETLQRARLAKRRQEKEFGAGFTGLKNSL